MCMCMYIIYLSDVYVYLSIRYILCIVLTSFWWIFTTSMLTGTRCCCLRCWELQPAHYIARVLTEVVGIASLSCWHRQSQFLASPVALVTIWLLVWVFNHLDVSSHHPMLPCSAFYVINFIVVGLTVGAILLGVDLIDVAKKIAGVEHLKRCSTCSLHGRDNLFPCQRLLFSKISVRFSPLLSSGSGQRAVGPYLSILVQVKSSNIIFENKNIIFDFQRFFVPFRSEIKQNHTRLSSEIFLTADCCRPSSHSGVTHIHIPWSHHLPALRRTMFF